MNSPAPENKSRAEQHVDKLQNLATNEAKRTRRLAQKIAQVRKKNESIYH